MAGFVSRSEYLNVVSNILSGSQLVYALSSDHERNILNALENGSERLWFVGGGVIPCDAIHNVRKRAFGCPIRLRLSLISLCLV